MLQVSFHFWASFRPISSEPSQRPRVRGGVARAGRLLLPNLCLFPRGVVRTRCVQRQLLLLRIETPFAIILNHPMRRDADSGLNWTGLEHTQFGNLGTGRSGIWSYFLVRLASLKKATDKLFFGQSYKHCICLCAHRSKYLKV